MTAREIFEREFPREEVDVESRTISVYWTLEEYEAAFAGWQAALKWKEECSHA